MQLQGPYPEHGLDLLELLLHGLADDVRHPDHRVAVLKLRRQTIWGERMDYW